MASFSALAFADTMHCPKPRESNETARVHHEPFLNTEVLYSQEGIMNKEPDFEIPAEMRAMAEKSVAQAKQAFEGFMTAAQKAANLAEGQATTAHTAAKQASSMAIEFAERNMTSAFVLAQKLVQARDPAHPRQLADFGTPSMAPEVHTAELQRVNGKLYGFLSCILSNPPCLVVVDLSDPANPRQVKVLTTGDPYQHDCWIKDGVLYTAGWDQGMRIWDIGGAGRGGSPESPVEISSVQTVGGAVHNIATYDDPISGKKFALIGEEHVGTVGKSSAGDIHVVDISDLTKPKEVAYYHVEGAGTAQLRPRCRARHPLRGLLQRRRPRARHPRRFLRRDQGPRRASRPGRQATARSLTRWGRTPATTSSGACT